MKRLKLILLCSLAINLAFGALSALVVYRRGGISYLKSKVMPSPTRSTPPAEFIDSNMYRGRQSAFAVLPQRQAAIIFIGDSITDFCQWNELLQRPDVLNRGLAADTVEGVGRRIGEALRHHPRKLFVMIGINNLLRGDDPDQLIMAYRSLIQTVKESSPQTRIFVQSILPINSTLPGMDQTQAFSDHILKVNRALSEFADGKQVIYVDLYSSMTDTPHLLSDKYTFDGVHLNGDGYLKWRDVIRPFIDE
jgi:lysophospholipase L1-like esterase